MAIVNPSSAVIAKARAKHGHRLTERDYATLVKCSSVSEIVQHLKSYTYYSTFLDKVSTDIHRGNLENILRQKLFENFLSLCRYSKMNSPVSLYLLRRAEIRELMKFIILLSNGKPEEYIFTMPLYFTEHTDIDLAKIAYIRTHEELTGMLQDTEYRGLLDPFKPDADGKYPIAEMEDALEIYSGNKLYADVNAIKNKKEKQQLLSLFDTLFDYNNYSRIIRLKKFYHLSSDAIRRHLLPFGALKGSRLDTILLNDSYEDVRAALAQTTAVGRKAQKIDIHHEMAVQGKYDKCRRELYFSTNPDIVLLAYCILSETELYNVITAVEGVRYSLEPEKIKEMLIL